MLLIKNRLKKKEDFNRVYRFGKSFFYDKIVLKVVDKGDLSVRVGIVISVKYSKKAVTRNRLKRQIRAFFRENIEKISGGKDIMVIVQKGWNEKINPAETIRKILSKNRLI